jgi:hypothetical protein
MGFPGAGFQNNPAPAITFYRKVGLHEFFKSFCYTFQDETNGVGGG